MADADVLTEIPWSDNPDAHSNAGDVARPHRTPALSRRGCSWRPATGIGARRRDLGRPDADPARADRTARRAAVDQGAARGAGEPHGRPGRNVAELRSTRRLAARASPARGPTSSPSPRSSDWRPGGGPLPDHLCGGLERRRALARRPLCSTSFARAGGDAGSRVRVVSLEHGAWRHTRRRSAGRVRAAGHPPQRRAAGHRPRLSPAAHRPDPAGVLNTKWLTRVEVL